jgi:hypothetical protein
MISINNYTSSVKQTAIAYSLNQRSRLISNQTAIAAQEREQKEKLAAYLRSLGIDPEKI